uniref:Uncharacterized protein n=1 Tax=Globodera rostochiensis TaxID=31243 RepID=A0A914I6Q9_GLORO
MAAALLLAVFALLAQFEALFSEQQLRIGAVFRKEQDAHLVAAFNYSLHWLHNRNILLSDGIPEREAVFGIVTGFMEILEDSEDYYELLEKACRLINERNVHALVGPAHLHQSELLADLSAKLRLPFFSLVDPLAHHFLNPSDGNLVRENASTATAAEAEAVHLEMFPHTQLLEAIIDLVKYWRWSRVIVIYRQPERIRRLIVFLESDSLASIRFNLVNIEHDDFLGAAKRVKELEECGEMTNRQQQGQCSEFSRLLLDMDPHDTHQFLLAALKVGLVELKHWFLSTSLDLRNMDMELFRHNHAHFLGLDPVNSNPTADQNAHVPSLSVHHQRLLPDFDEFKQYIHAHATARDPSAGSDGLKMSEAAFLFDSVYLLSRTFASGANNSARNLLFSSGPTTAARCASGQHAHRPFEFGIQIARQVKQYANTLHGFTGKLGRLNHDGANSNFTFRINLLGYTGEIDDIGYWEGSAATPILNVSDASRAQLRRNVKVSNELKPRFRVTTILERPYVMLRTTSNDNGGGTDTGRNGHEQQNAKFEGFCIDLLAELAQDLGFTYTIHVVQDNKYGKDNGNNSWDGMIGELLRGEADMVMAPFTANFRRAEVLDFTKPFLSLGISVLYRIPEDYQPDIFSFLNPLSLEIWLCILLSICGITFGMYLVANVTPYEWNLNFSCCTAHQPHPAAQFSTVGAGGDKASTTTRIQLSNNYSFWNTLW